MAQVLQDLPPVDLAAPTPCHDYHLRALVEHAAGTTGALARVGLGESLDPESPWGGGEGVAEQDWAAVLEANLEAIAQGWSDEQAWEGTVEVGSSSLPAPMIGSMALIEVAMHGWDLARSLGRNLELDDSLGSEVLAVASASAEMGRSMGAFGLEVEIPDTASPFEQALAATGRDPLWRPRP